jgi:hypothetical protein
VSQNQKKNHASATIRPAEASAGPREKTAPEELPAALESGWKPQADFTVFFEYRQDEHGEKEWRTRIYLAQGKGEDIPFDVFPASGWADFMLERAGFPKKAVPPIKKIQAKHPKTGAPVEIEFLNIDINAGPQELSGMLEIQGSFKFCGERVPALMKAKHPYQVEFYVVELETEQVTLVAFEHGEMKPRDGEHEVRQMFRMPHPGRYELRTFVLLPALGISAAHCGPIFNITQREPVTRAAG